MCAGETIIKTVCKQQDNSKTLLCAWSDSCITIHFMRFQCKVTVHLKFSSNCSPHVVLSVVLHLLVQYAFLSGCQHFKKTCVLVEEAVMCEVSRQHYL